MVMLSSHEHQHPAMAILELREVLVVESQKMSATTVGAQLQAPAMVTSLLQAAPLIPQNLRPPPNLRVGMSYRLDHPTGTSLHHYVQHLALTVYLPLRSLQQTSSWQTKLK